jgi:hypothetical protein
MSERRVSEIVGVLRQVRDRWHEQGLYGDVEMGAAAELIEQQQAAIKRVRELCEQTTVSVSIGCRCYTDECSGTCGAGRPLSWHLNPAAVLAALDGDSDE